MMSSFKRVVVLTLTLTPSGALSPGPLSASAIALGALMGPLAGFMVALGHTLVELPYVMLLYKVASILRVTLGRFKLLLNIFMTLFLIYFSYLLLMDSINIALGSTSPTFNQFNLNIGNISLLNAIIVGVILTGFNVYFLLWWLTVGYPMVEEASKLGVRGLTVMYASHVWMDYAWLTLLAGSGGVVRLLGSTPYSILLAILAVILALFAARIAVETLRSLRAQAYNPVS